MKLETESKLLSRKLKKTKLFGSWCTFRVEDKLYFKGKF